MVDVSTKILSILSGRQVQRDEMVARRQVLQRVERSVAELLDAGRALAPEDPSDLREAVASLGRGSVQRDIADAINALSIAEARFSRSTVNIGVSGQARVGKSTLLQTISGLTDDQIPTGSGIPVTAVRSRIFHSATQQRAVITLHTFQTFRDKVLAPYHRALRLPDPPFTAAEFRSFSYPSPRELREDVARLQSSITTLDRLKKIQSSFASYERDLCGGERIVDLSELRPYVAYPTSEEASDPSCARRYLAVSDIRIECRFARAQVERLGLIDLPGLGELDPEAEEHHLAALRDEVDLVLLMKRPVEGMAFWGKNDGSAADLLDRARGPISRRGDFVLFVVNEGETGNALIRALKENILQTVNEGQDGLHYRVLQCDARSPASVDERAVGPALAHLIERLPVMDREIADDALRRTNDVVARLRRELEALKASARPQITEDDDVVDRSRELQNEVAAALEGLLVELYETARDGRDDDQYVDVVEGHYKGTLNWIEQGFGRGREVWEQTALKSSRRHKNISPFLADELNRIRVEISQRFTELDLHYNAIVQNLWDQVAETLRRHTGVLIPQGDDALRAFHRALLDAPEPMPVMLRAMEGLLRTSLQYRAHLHPRVRRALDPLNHEVKDGEGRPVVQIMVDMTPEGMSEAFEELSKLAEQAAYETRKAILHEGQLPALVLHAAAEQFTDELIRAEGAERDFRRLARSFRDEIWPGVFASVAARNTRVGRVRRAANEVETILAGRN